MLPRFGGRIGNVRKGGPAGPLVTGEDKAVTECPFCAEDIEDAAMGFVTASGTFVVRPIDEDNELIGLEIWAAGPAAPAR